jgi:hypothetical protein
VNTVADNVPVEGLNVSLLVDIPMVVDTPETVSSNATYRVAFVNSSFWTVTPPLLFP